MWAAQESYGPRKSCVACTLYIPTHKISYVPVGSFISPGNACLGPGSSLAPGNFSAVSGSIQAVSRSQIDPRKPDVTSGAFYPHFEELKSCSCWQLHPLLELGLLRIFEIADIIGYLTAADKYRQGFWVVDTISDNYRRGFWVANIVFANIRRYDNYRQTITCHSKLTKLGLVGRLF